MEGFPDFANLANARSIEELYRKYKEDPTQVENSWRSFFEGLDFSSYTESPISSDAAELFFKVFQLVKAYREYGHLKAQINPLTDVVNDPRELSLANFGLSQENLTQLFPTCDVLEEEMAPLEQTIARLESIYCQKVGFEYRHLDHPELEKWLQNKIEKEMSFEAPKEDALTIFQSLVEADGIETFIHTRYAAQKRFSVEGGESIIPILQEMAIHGSDFGLQDAVIAMAHRGRLNVLVNVMRKPYSVVLFEFEDFYQPTEVEGTGDTSYHKGYSHNYTREDKSVQLHLCANPSHLESVFPAAVGEVKAKQDLKNTQDAKRQVAPFIIHGDGAFASQGVVYETMQMYKLPGYSVGGTVHLIINNQLGFTTPEEESRSTRYCTDIAKGFGFPVFHVNTEDPISCVQVAKLAIEVRQKFQIDVVIDIVGYRKYGHNEGDEPSFTQPKMYEIIRKKPSVLEIFRKDLLAKKIAGEEELNQKVLSFRDLLVKEQEIGRGYKVNPPTPEVVLGEIWALRKQAPAEQIFKPVDTKFAIEKLKDIIEKTTQVPEGFAVHPKLVKWIENRRAVLDKSSDEACIDWGLAEHLAFGSLLLENVAIRLSGQDTIRGTFSHRHAAWICTEKRERYFSLQHLAENQPKMDTVNSSLSEYACLAFEYGYSLSNPAALVIWEAQYGDFANGAQIAIDQYIVSGEQKWGRFSSLTLFLPHGYESKGPEHSSARIERFLAAAANLNIQLVNLTTPRQFFHVLRRQKKLTVEKPLIIFTPKNLLRHPKSVSSLKDLSTGGFEEVLDDPETIQNSKRLLFCSGRVFFDLWEKRTELKNTDTVIVRVEQIYPLHREKLQKIFDKYKNVQECFWVQEEPENMGAWMFLANELRGYLQNSQTLNYIGRAPSASPAVGSNKVHNLEKQQYLKAAFESRG